MPDVFANVARTLRDPAEAADAITPSDSTDLTRMTRAVYVGQTGDLSVILASGDTVSFASVQAGSIYPLRVQRVLATGTTAGGLVGLA